MCGISGVLYFDGRLADEGVVRQMSDVQRHRGPDESGIHIGPGIGLGHRRLSIIDLSSGQQPLCNEDGSIWISFNGEIYNFRELNLELTERHHFRTKSDTETIVHLYEEFPTRFIEKLRGMFAFALWDGPRKTLILARDRVGKKPLYYYVDHEKLVFGSEIKAILRHPELTLGVNDFAICDYLSLGYIPAPKSIYRQIHKIQPGHFLEVRNGQVREQEYWNLKFCAQDGPSVEEWTERLVEEFRDAVRIRLMSEVPLGAFLSGGIDSSAVVAMMSEVVSHPVKTATIGFQEDSFDESGFAQEVAKHLQTDHHEKVVTPDKINAIETLVWHYDEPFADSSALPTYYVSQVAREHVTVALSGDGGDENFAGYRRYHVDHQENRLRSVLPLNLRKAVFGPLAQVYPKMDWAPRVLRAKSTFQSLAHDPVEGYFETMSTFRGYEKPLVLSDSLKARLGDYQTVELFRRHYQRAETQDPLSCLQYLDIKTYLADDILTKVDRASMANSLEVRCPLLDHRLMELAATMPSPLKLRGRIGKFILKKAMEQRLPARVLTRTKMGFGVPLVDWFRDGIRDFARKHLVEREDPYLSTAFVCKIWEQHQSGVRDRSAQLWNVLMFRLWLQRFSD
jgi:asparagine synthase (glutamine-hydrolysing)